MIKLYFFGMMIFYGGWFAGTNPLWSYFWWFGVLLAGIGLDFFLEAKVVKK